MLDKFDWWLIALITAIYALLSGINFAENYHYHSHWQANVLPAQLHIHLAKPTALKAIDIVTALNSGDYTVALYNDQLQQSVQQSTNPIVHQQLIESFSQSAAKLSAAAFRWNQQLMKNQKSPVTDIVLTVTKAVVNLDKIALINSSGQLVTNYTIYSQQQAAKTIQNNLIAQHLAKHIDNNWQSSTIFDEIYYATSAYQYLHGISPGAWVNPQLGILLIALGVIICGMSPLGWRIMPDISSILLVGLIYIFAKRMFNCRKVAVISAILLSCEFMHYTIGRIALIEPFVALFATCGYYFLYCYIKQRLTEQTFVAVVPYLTATGLSLGLAMASKWVGLFPASAILLSVLSCEINALYREKLTLSCFALLKVIFLRSICLLLLLVVLPLVVYLLSYLPYVLVNHNLPHFFSFVYQVQLWMLDFNLHGLKHATHPYASRFLSWPLDIMPLSVYYWQDSRGYLSSSMAIMGNPAIFWPMWVVVTLLCYKYLENRRNYNAGFLLLILMAQYLPYALISRISFIYYFYSVTPLLILAISYVINLVFTKAQAKKKYHYFVYAYVALVLFLFILFFPALSGIDIPRSYVVRVLWWLPSWNF